LFWGCGGGGRREEWEIYIERELGGMRMHEGEDIPGRVPLRVGKVEVEVGRV